MSRISEQNVHPRNMLPLIIRLFTLCFIVFAVSGAHLNYTGTGTTSDYVLAIDVSSSMTIADVKPTRIEAAKEAAVEFMNSVPAKTKVGLVSFSGTSFVEQQMTEKKEEIISRIYNLNINSLGGTDIGQAIVTSTNLLFSSLNTKSIVLLTDGESNIGLGVSKAIDYTKDNNVQVFTIGVGTIEGGSPEGTNLTNITLKMDEETLKLVAESTEGKYFLAKSKEEISRAYEDIIKISEKRISLNLTLLLMFFAFITSFIDWLLMNTKYQRIP